MSLKILFAVKKLDVYEPLSIMLLSAVLKKEGHQVLFFNSEYENMLDVVKKNQPDILAISTSSTFVNFYLKLARDVKNSFGTYVVFGGAHPTFFPEVIEDESVDAICRGEGERAFSLFLNHFGTEAMNNVFNMWVKNNRKIIKNDMGPLHEDLDSLPFEDRDLVYSKDPYFKKAKLRSFIASRGCPYDCTYCYAHSYRKLYSGKGKLYRWKSPQYLIEEIKIVKSKYPLEFIKFLDDTFILNKTWLEDFSKKYGKNLKIPFHCWARADLIDDDVCKMLKEASCFSINFSIECGNDNIRNNVLKRNMSKEQILNAARLLRKYGFKFAIQNMIGLPGETMENIYETVDLNTQCKPDYSWASLYIPLPRTELATHAVQKGYFDGRFNELPETDYLFTPLKFPKRLKKQISHFHKYFAIRVQYPRLHKLINLIVKMPQTKISFMIYVLFYAFSIKRRLYRYKTSLPETYISFRRFLNHIG